MEMKYTLSEVLKHMYLAYQNPKALNDFVDGKWESVSTRDLLLAVEEIALGLHAIGVERGQRIAIMAFPSSLWTIVDMAIIIAGAVSVPIFPNISEENLVFQVEQSDSRFLFLGDQISLYHGHKDLFKKVIGLDLTLEEEKFLSLEDLKVKGREYRDANPEKYKQLLDSAKPEDLATIIYTSGSTGVPKGAEITNHNLVALVSISTNEFNWVPEEDKYLSILPLAHVFGRVLNICLVAWGVSVYYLNDPKQLAEQCQNIHPTILVVVPRLLEKVYSKMLAKVESAGTLKKAIAHWAFDLANDEHDDSLLKQILHPIADKIVYSTLRDSFGGSLRIVISGGAPLNPHLTHFYIDIGLPIYEGWGMTEASTITVNRPGIRKIGSVGKPLETMQIKTTAEGEVLVKGPIVMRGYYKNEEATKAAFDEDGWLKTGDKGSIDQDGYLTLVGRLKELLKTSTGEYVVPVPIEQQLSKIPIVDLAMVVAERRKFTTCLLFPDMEILQKLKSSLNKTDLDDESFLNSDELRKDMQKSIDQINSHLGKSEKIQNFVFVPDVPSIEKGELTPSMKIRRDFVENKYKDLINSMYPEEDV